MIINILWERRETRVVRREAERGREEINRSIDPLGSHESLSAITAKRFPGRVQVADAATRESNDAVRGKKEEGKRARKRIRPEFCRGWYDHVASLCPGNSARYINLNCRYRRADEWKINQPRTTLVSSSFRAMTAGQLRKRGKFWKKKYPRRTMKNVFPF